MSRRMISESKIRALKKIELTNAGLEISDPVEFNENIKVDGNVNVDGKLNIKGVAINVEEGRVGVYYHVDEEPDQWKQVANAYSETTKLAHGITAANVVENQWTTATTPPPGGESIQDGEILYVVGFVGSMVLLCLGAGPDAHYWYSDNTTSKLKIKTGTYTVDKDTYSGYEEGVEEHDIFLKFALES